jgi:cell division protein FtsZ
MDSIVAEALKRARQGASNKQVVQKSKSRKRAVRTRPSGKSKKLSDADFSKVLERSKAKIRVVGVGGGGCNTIQRMMEVGIKDAETFAVNTDAQDLLSTHADKKILIGRETTHGLGSGSDPPVGEASARESYEELNEALADTDLLFITCGLGGGTGTGASPVIAEIGKQNDALVVAVVTLPFTVEGRKRTENALEGLRNLEKNVDTLIVIPNDKILEIAPDLPINSAFKVADEVLTNAVKGITEMITKPGLINLDFADLRTILRKGGAAMMGLGESYSEEASEARALEAVENALTSPLLDVDISEARRALINVVGGQDMTLREAEMVVETVSSKIHPDAHIIWGAMVDDKMPKNKIQAMVVISGGRFPYLTESGTKGAKTIDLGIEFTE